jgi:hypothetical protein
MEDNILTARMPPPTDEIKGLMVQLDNPDFFKREAADEALRKKGFAALRILEEHERIGPPEVSLRCRHILQEYYNLKLPNDVMPGILRIPVDGCEFNTDAGGKLKIGKKDRRGLYNYFWRTVYNDNPYHWYDADVSKKAMWNIVPRLLRQGVPKEDVEKWLEEISDPKKDDYDKTDFGNDSGEPGDDTESK